MRKISLALAVLLGVQSVGWASEYGEKDPVIATAVLGGWGAATASVTGGLAASW